MTVETERTVVVDQSDPNRGRYDPSRVGKHNPANHWAARPGPAGRPRNRTSLERRATMCALLAAPPGWSLDWVQPPVLVADTRLAMMANPRTGRMLLQGWERTGAATAVLDMRRGGVRLWPQRGMNDGGPPPGRGRGEGGRANRAWNALEREVTRSR